MIWGVVWGGIQSAAPLGLWWLDAAGVTGSAWLLVIGFAGHGLKDLWQHRTHYVANTRWWPPFCLTIDFIAAAVIAVGIAKGASFHG